MVGSQGFVHYWELFHFRGLHYSERCLHPVVWKLCRLIKSKKCNFEVKCIFAAYLGIVLKNNVCIHKFIYLHPNLVLIFLLWSISKQARWLKPFPLVTLTAHLFLWSIRIWTQVTSSLNGLTDVNHIPWELILTQVRVLHVNAHPSFLQAPIVLAGLFSLSQANAAIHVGLRIRSCAVPFKNYMMQYQKSAF